MLVGSVSERRTAYLLQDWDKGTEIIDTKKLKAFFFIVFDKKKTNIELPVTWLHCNHVSF
jgi:hypothetical protein